MYTMSMASKTIIRVVVLLFYISWQPACCAELHCLTRYYCCPGGGRSDEEKVRVLAEHSAAAMDFLYSRGLNLSDIVQLGGHTAARTHRFPPTADGKPLPVGFTIVNALRKYVESDLSGYVTVKTQCLFQGLHSDEQGRVDGVSVRCAAGEGVEVVKGAVVLAAGGYANDRSDSSLLRQYAPDLYAYPTTNGPWATGDVIKALRKDRSISLVDMDQVQVHPTGFVDPKDPTFHTKFLAPEALRGCGAILLGKDGKRFANELGRRDYLTQQILEHGWRYDNKADTPIVAAMLLTDAVINKFSAPSAGFYKFKGLIVDVKTLAGAGEHLGVSEQQLQQTLKGYRDAADDSEDDFGKAVFPTVLNDDDHFYVAYITPTLHYCMGGIEINSRAQVLVSNNGDTQPLSGVYAAGEVSGGVHGRNRLGGNSLLECVVFGRLAGQRAAHYKVDAVTAK